MEYFPDTSSQTELLACVSRLVMPNSGLSALLFRILKEVLYKLPSFFFLRGLFSRGEEMCLSVSD